MTKVNIITSKTIKAEDTRPPLRAQLLYDNGDPVNLTDHTVLFRMRRSDGTGLLVDDMMVVENPSRGIVARDWQDGETDVSGTYEVEFEAADLDGSTITFPSDNYEMIYIEDKLGQ